MSNTWLLSFVMLFGHIKDSNEVPLSNDSGTSFAELKLGQQLPVYTYSSCSRATWANR